MRTAFEHGSATPLIVWKMRPEVNPADVTVLEPAFKNPGEKICATQEERREK
jgi:hypothetical protein